MSAFVAWLRALLKPVTPGMDEASPRARLLPVVIMVALIALQVWARYRWGFLNGTQWQAVHIVLGLVMCLGVITLFHGPGLVCRVRTQTWVLLGLGVLFFCLFWYFGRMDSYRRYIGTSMGGGTFSPVYPFLYFSLAAFLFRTVLPFGSARLLFRLRPGQLGFRARTNPHPGKVPWVGWVYVALYLGLLPFLFMVAEQPAFQAKYPMSRAMIDSAGGIAIEHFLVYQAFYALIFVSGEGFWRGFLSFGTEKDFGLYGLVLMLVPYVTGHFGKPLPETLGAIAAGLTLGFLALKHRSVWYGVAVHYGVALTMDLLAIQANGFVVYAGD